MASNAGARRGVGRPYLSFQYPKCSFLVALSAQSLSEQLAE